MAPPAFFERWLESLETPELDELADYFRTVRSGLDLAQLIADIVGEDAVP